MTTRKIIFIGATDPLLKQQLKENGVTCTVNKVEHHQVWSRRTLVDSQETGYYMSRTMRQLIEQAANHEFDYIVIRTSASFAIEVLMRIPPYLRSKVILDIRRKLDDPELMTLMRLGLNPSNVTTREIDKTLAELISNMEAA